MKRIRGASKQQLHGFIQEAVEPDSTIHTDGWEGYVGLEALGYRHEYDFLAGSSQSASELLPHVHRVAALLKRWLIGTHQGAVSREHLDYYLDEYTFRFNRRRSRHRGKLFYRLVQQAATVGPTTYSEMVQHLRGRRTGQPQDVGWSGVKCIPRKGECQRRHRLRRDGPRRPDGRIRPVHRAVTVRERSGRDPRPSPERV